MIRRAIALITCSLRTAMARAPKLEYYLAINRIASIAPPSVEISHQLDLTRYYCTYSINQSHTRIAMKVFVNYQDNEDETKHKTLKITLPKSWRNGPTTRLLEFFIESYNSSAQGEHNPLNANEMHLELRVENDADSTRTTLKTLSSDDVIVEHFQDRQDVFVMHGPARTREEIQQEIKQEKAKEEHNKQNTVACTHFGCQQRFPRGGPYPKCLYHKSPPIFHETAKYWSCCPHKKAYDWEEFQSIPGCEEGVCSEVRDTNNAISFLGGCDVREALGQSQEGPKLRSIEDFNKAAAMGGSATAPVLDRLKSVLEELGIEQELFDQVVEGIKKEISVEDSSVSEVSEGVKERLGKKLKDAMKAIAVEQLRIK